MEFFDLHNGLFPSPARLKKLLKADSFPLLGVTDDSTAKNNRRSAKHFAGVFIQVSTGAFVIVGLTGVLTFSQRQQLALRDVRPPKK